MSKKTTKIVQERCPKRICHFHKGRDIMEVVPDASENITAAIFDGSIKDANMPKLFNGFENMEDIGYRVRDVFDMEDYSHEMTRLKGEEREKAESSL